MSETKKGRQITWYRTPIERELLRELSQRSNWRGAVQTVGFLACYAATFSAALYGWNVGWAWWAVGAIVFAHGTVTAFMINAVHELGHQTVFRIKWCNNVFMRLFSFLGWINFQWFHTSHGRHHAYTLHPPDDLEVVLPVKLMVRHFLRYGFVNVTGPYYQIKDVIRIARGRFQGEWEMILYPPDAPEKRRPAVRWARVMLIGHALVVAVSLYFHQWLIAILVTLGPFYGGWLQFICNNTQHIGLQDNVPDFRLCCRTFTLNPVFRLLYWQMNYHTEHHMFPTVPCYNLGRLHERIRDDLPYCPNGLVDVWKQIIRILRKQKEDPAYQFVPELPAAGGVAAG